MYFIVPPPEQENEYSYEQGFSLDGVRVKAPLISEQLHTVVLDFPPLTMSVTAPGGVEPGSHLLQDPQLDVAHVVASP